VDLDITRPHPLLQSAAFMPGQNGPKECLSEFSVATGHEAACVLLSPSPEKKGMD
jgi:hypothetical protein